MSKYYSINKFSKILGVSAQTLRNWDKKGKPFEIISYKRIWQYWHIEKVLYSVYYLGSA